MAKKKTTGINWIFYFLDIFDVDKPLFWIAILVSSAATFYLGTKQLGIVGGVFSVAIFLVLQFFIRKVLLLIPKNIRLGIIALSLLYLLGKYVTSLV